ncbi:enoyl-CoA hydratase-related protein [Pelagibius sp. Alg239-R121]|uniref:enoyl-CoA hydratase-related protein n=1 Tax=Pelagibius sp. Alg239-R121 TaxID=2993448 RepID=UPI0024A6DD88|nr:enoyl-CoA hydratase-related protein [Pelagibius sp. Alg239-R121]
MSDTVLLQRDGAIATITLNRPERRNAFNLEMWSALGDVMADLNGDDGLRCVVLRGAGDKAFAAGADIAEFSKVRFSAKQAEAYAETMDRATDAVRDCPHPTLAMIRGACVGGGLELAIHCDLRISGRSGRIGIPINRIGNALPYAAMIALVEAVGRPTVLELLLEGRIFDAEEACAKGLITRVVEDGALEAEVQATAGRIAAGAPLVARAHKIFSRKAAAPSDLQDKDWAAPFEICDSEDYREGIRAFLAKESPNFTAQ